MRPRGRACTGLAVAVLLATAATASAGEHDDDEGQSPRDYDEARSLRDRGEIVPLEQIMQAATRERAGRVVEVELEHESGVEGGAKGYVYEIEILDAGGDVWELRYDARTGVLRNQKKGH